MLPVTYLPPANKYLKKLKDKQLKRKYLEAIIKIRKNRRLAGLKRVTLPEYVGMILAIMVWIMN